ncbi:hypothetical protein K438DRAFT_1849830 [Mycena galopus ATCC 62051]|nr:hypothetical protein K438DRAFT_1849830 [Mycena galopus ATCC 62051]
MDHYCLRFRYRLQSNTTIVSLIERVSTDMANSDRKWQFGHHSHALRQLLSRNETQPLQLLALGNRGIARIRDGLVTLSRQPPDSQLTLKGLFTPTNVSKYCRPQLTIRGKLLILNFVVAQSGITGLAKLAPRLSFSSRRHACLPRLMHGVYSRVNETRATPSDWTPPECDSEGETDDEMEVADALMDLDVENSPPTPTPMPTASSVGTISAENSQSSSSSLSQADLWATAWVPTRGRYRALYESSHFAKSLFESAASSSRPTRLIISGQSIPELAFALVSKIKEADLRNDFTEVFSPQRSYNILRDDGSLLTTGVGIGREVLYTAWLCYQQHAGQWFLSRFDGKCSIATTMPLVSANLVNADRRQNLVVLGCLAALLLIHGIAPEPLSPALIQWAANKCDLGSLTREFIGEWFPELRTLLDDWVSTGPTGDIRPFANHFAIYHDIQVASLQGRDQPQHQALGFEMLYTSVIGPQPPTHTELKAFVKGLRSPCANGLDFCDVIRSYPGGSTGFISRLWTSVIHNFDSIKSHLSVVTTPTRESLIDFVGQDSPVLDMDLAHMLQEWLKGSGIPCPGLFEIAKPTLSKLIPFGDVDSPAFRPKMFCWSGTGSPHVEWEDHQQLSVYFVGPDDEQYHSSPIARRGYMKMGIIRFQSCFRTIRIPILYLAELSKQSYPAKDDEGNDTEPFSLQQAIDNWFLIQTLTGIGEHSLL